MNSISVLCILFLASLCAFVSVLALTPPPPSHWSVTDCNWSGNTLLISWGNWRLPAACIKEKARIKNKVRIKRQKCVHSTGLTWTVCLIRIWSYAKVQDVQFYTQTLRCIVLTCPVVASGIVCFLISFTCRRSWWRFLKCVRGFVIWRQCRFKPVKRYNSLNNWLEICSGYWYTFWYEWWIK